MPLQDLDFGTDSNASSGGLPDLDFGPISAGSKVQPARTIKGTLGDVANTVAQASVGAGEALVGLGNLATSGAAGKFMQDNLGYDPKRTREILNSNLRSDAQAFADEKVEKADGFVETVKAAVQNPSTIVKAGVESVPSIFLGGAVAKGAKALGAGRVASAAIGEGVIGAGASAESIRQQTKDGDLTLGQTAIAAISGGITGLLGAAGGKVAKSLGIADIDQAVAGATTEASKKMLARRVVEGAVAEGVIEEMPQSAFEQMASNLALDKPLDEGVGNAAAMGMLTGAALGGATNISRTSTETKAPPAAPQIAEEVKAAAAQVAPVAPAGPSTIAPIVAEAFAEIGGDETAVQGQQQTRSMVAMSLSQIAASDGEDALMQTISRISGGDETLAKALLDSVENPEMLAAGREAQKANVPAYIELNESIRQDAGLIQEDGAAVPTVATPEQQVATPVPTAGLDAQVSAVRDGLMNGAFIDMALAEQMDLSGLAAGEVSDETGRVFQVVGLTNEAVQSAVALASQVGVVAASQQLETPVQGKAVVNGQVVAPEQAAQVAPGQTPDIKTVEQVLAERAAQLPDRQIEGTADSARLDEQSAPMGNPSSFYARAKPASASVGMSYKDAPQSGLAAQLVERLNRENGLQGDQQIDPASITEVQPTGSLARFAAALPAAFGVKLVMVKSTGGLMRLDGTQFNGFRGIADRASKTVFINADANVPLNVLGHELTHLMETESPEAYDALEVAVLARLRAPAARRLQASLRSAMEGEGASNPRIAAEFRMEVVAEAIGEMAEDPALWNEVFAGIGQDQTLAKRLYQMVLDVIAKLEPALTKAGFITGSRDVTSMKKAVAAAYKQWSAEYETKGENQDNLTEDGKAMLAQFKQLAEQPTGSKAEEQPAVDKAPAAPKKESKKKAPAAPAATKVAPTPEKAQDAPVPAPAGRLDGPRKAVSFNQDEAGVAFAREVKAVSTSQLLRSLTPAERAKVTEKTAAKIIAHMQNLPDSKEMAAIAYAGRAKRGWYKQSADAISAVFGMDGPRFAALLAAMSPQCSVETNLLNTLNTWKNWVAAGRPTEREAIIDVMAASVQGEKGRDSVLGAWINNSVRALSMDDVTKAILSGPKVNSFYGNLVGVVDEVTNDAWMANYANIDQKLFAGSLNVRGTDPGKGTGYLAMSAAVRGAAAKLTKLTGETWTPAEVQETIWSWSKTIYEMADDAKESRSAKQLVADSAVTDELINSTPDFGSLFYDSEYSSILKEAGYAQQLESLRGAVERARSQSQQVAASGGQAAPFAAGTQRRLETRAAERLDAVRVERRSQPESAFARELPGDGAGRDQGRGLAPLPGAPNVVGASGPDPRLTKVAEDYARSIGVNLKRQSEYVQVDPDRAARIASAYDAMPHAPQDPRVKEAYDNLIQQTLSQYRALVKAGYEFYLVDETNDPYGGNPWNAMRDLRANQRMGVFATEAGFGSGASDLDVTQNPLLADTGIKWSYGKPGGPKKRVLANDLFRAVHDAFGHGLEGSGFRAQGEENAWQAHVRLFTGSALGAITSETRGQNSWLNYGPHGEKNRNAKVEDTVFADQKTGLMPEWTWSEGAVGGEAPTTAFARSATKLDSVQDILDFAATGRQPMELGDLLDRGRWADAYQAAKDPVERSALMRQLGRGLIERFADSKIRLSDWIAGLGVGDNLKQKMEGDLRRSDTMRSAMEKRVKDKFTDPMFKAITKAAKQTGKSTDQIKKAAGSWMAAVYVPEANAQLIQKDRVALAVAQAAGDPQAIALAQQQLQDRILSVNGAIGDQRSRGVAGGMNNAEAAKARADFEAMVPVALLEEIAKPVYEMLAWKKRKDIASGKVSQTMVNSWLNSPRYVPLTGDPRHDRESADVFSAGGQLNQDKDHAMNGRMDSVPDDGIDAAFTATIKSINFSAMQDFKKGLNEAYVQSQAAGVDIGLTREPITGIVRTGDDVVMYRDNGVAANGVQTSMSYAFRFKDQRIIESLKKDNVESTGLLLRAISAPTRWYARAVTQFMPMFAPVNLVRDIWERSELLRTRKLYDTAGNLVDVKKAARDSIMDVINRDIWKASIMKSFKKGGRNPVRDDLEQMIRLGGVSNWGDYLSKSSGDLEAEIRGSGGPLVDKANAGMELVEAWNNSFEFVPSLSMFRALKAQNMAPEAAAAAVLDLMNFRKKGTAMPALRALYIFAQPAATSGYNLSRYLSTPIGRKRFAAQALIAVGLYAMLAAAWGDDDDEEIGNQLDNLSNFTVERTIPIKLGDYTLKLPVGFGPPQLAWAFGGIVNRWMSGRYDTGDALGELAKGWAKSFAPVAPSDVEVTKRPLDFLAQTLSPTIIKPLMSILMDQTGLGAPLTPFKNPDLLKSEQVRRSTAPIYQEIAREMQSMLGIDVYPDHIKAVSDGYLVGPFREMLNLSIEREAKEARGEPGRLPLVASVFDVLNDRSILNSVYARVRNDMDKDHRVFATMSADREQRIEITQEMRDQERAFQKFRTSEQMLGVQRSALKKQNLDDETRSERLRAIEERADAEHRRLLVEFFRTKEVQ